MFGCSFHLSLVQGHGRNVKIRKMLSSQSTSAYLDHKVRDALEAEAAETIFKTFFKKLFVSSAVSEQSR